MIIRLYKKNIISDYSDLINLIGLYVLSIVVVYFLPSIFKNFYFYFLLALFFKSEKDYFWFALILVLESSPGKLFNASDPVHNLAILNLAGFRYIYLQELFVMVALGKFIFYNRYKYEKLFFSNILGVLLLYTIFLFLLATFYGTDLIRFLGSIRSILPFALFIIIPAFFTSIEDYKKFFSLIFPFVFFVFATQLMESAVLKKNLDIALGGNLDFRQIKIGSRLFYSDWILLVAFIGAMFFLAYRYKSFSYKYLIAVLITVILSFTYSGTRGYVISTIFMMIMFLLIIQKINIKYIQATVFLSVIFIGLIFINPTVSSFLQSSINRISTLQYLIKGDPTAGGTLIRLTVRRPIVLNKFNESPIVGFGISEDYFQYADVHTGNETILLKGGIVGYVIMATFWIIFNFKLFHQNAILPVKNQIKNTLLVFIIGFLGLFIIHSSSGYIFNYGIRYQGGMAIAVIIFFTFADRVYKESKTKPLDKEEN